VGFISAFCLQRFLSVHHIGVFPFQSLSARSTNRYFDHLRGGIVERPFVTLFATYWIVFLIVWENADVPLK